MKPLLLSAAIAALALEALPAAAAPQGASLRIAGLEALTDISTDEFDRRGRGRGRGGDSREDRGGNDDRDSDDRRGGRGGHGGRPRVPGGSGCDDPHDIAEHPECRG
jgi:hypothetical protein